MEPLAGAEARTTVVDAQPRASLTQVHGSAALAIIVYLVGALAEFFGCLWLTRGNLVYGVDDAYVHLALAERLAHGLYGLNPHEFCAPSSSIVWPFLLLIGVGTSWHVYVPLALNWICGLGTAYMVGRCVDEWPWEREGRFASGKRAITTILFVLGFNLLGITYLGLEHMLQILLAVMCAYGIIRVSRGAEMPWWAIAAAIAGPAVRYENLAITVGVAVVLFMSGRKRAALWTFLASLVVPIAFSIFLVSHGWFVLPGSVLAKGTNGRGVEGFEKTLSKNFVDNFTDFVRLEWTLILLVAAELWWMRRKLRPVGIAAVTTVLFLFLAVGRSGNHRYECFVVAFATLILFAVLGREYGTRWHVVMVAFLVCAWPYLRYVYYTPVASQNIYQQQYQMARFEQQFYRKNFAANDIGLLSFQLPPNIYLADIAGLASRESLEQRDRSGAWLDSFVRRHDAGLAMIYPQWVRDISPAWSLRGQLMITSEPVAVPYPVVNIYATSVGNAAEIDADLREFRKTLPPGVVLALREESGN